MVKIMDTSYISLVDVVKEYKVGEVLVRAADGITFGVKKGELAVVLGPSGAGKTTALNLIGGMDSADSGHIYIDGTDIAKFTKRQLTAYRRKDIGFVFQFYNLVPNLTALENVELAAQICASKLNAGEMLEDVGLGEKKKNFPAQLSGGEQQRVAIARALAKGPKLLLCDEPTGALDFASGKKILSLLSHTSREKGMTVILITHNQSIAQIADCVVQIKNGKVTKEERNASPVPIEEVEW
jgi:putative ABC transport system ATP-binding protein